MNEVFVCCFYITASTCVCPRIKIQLSAIEHRVVYVFKNDKNSSCIFTEVQRVVFLFLSTHTHVGIFITLYVWLIFPLSYLVYDLRFSPILPAKMFSSSLLVFNAVYFIDSCECAIYKFIDLFAKVCKYVESLYRTKRQRSK